MKIEYVKSQTNRYGEREHHFLVGEKATVYCIPLGFKQSVEGLLRMLREKHGMDKDAESYVLEGLGEI